MIILDSSGWLEYFAGTKNSEIFESYAENFEELIVPTISIYEVFKIINRQFGTENANLAINFMQNGEVVPLDSSIATNAALISSEYKMPMADSIIYATGQKYNAKIITQDADFKGLPNVDYYEAK